jgi:hypothetical protein
MNDDIKRVQDIFDGNRQHIAFLVGNGINRYNSDKKQNNWLAILKNLWNHYCDLGKENYHFPANLENNDISYTELYDIIKGHPGYKYKKKKNAILEDLIGDMKQWQPKDHHSRFIEYAKELQAPVLTTNFDENLSNAVGKTKFQRLTRGLKGFTHHYPWECYYSSDVLSDTLDGFAIWNIHGSIHYKKSIKLGLNDYMGMVHRAKNFISNGLFRIGSEKRWVGAKTWMNIFFNKSLFIFGLALSREEIFLRWLLAERCKYLKTLEDTNRTIRKGWYIHVQTKNDEMDYGRKLYLRSVELEVLTLPSYKDLYETIWRSI